MGYYDVGHHGKADFSLHILDNILKKKISGQKSPNCRNFPSMSRLEDGLDLKRKRWGSFEISITQNFLASHQKIKTLFGTKIQHTLTLIK